MGTGSVGADMNDAEFYTADLAYIHDTGFGDFARLWRRACCGFSLLPGSTLA